LATVWNKFVFFRELIGFEVPVLVHFTKVLGGSYDDKIYSRCCSKLIIICDEGSEKVAAFDSDAITTKPIFGEFQ